MYIMSQGIIQQGLDLCKDNLVENMVYFLLMILCGILNIQHYSVPNWIKLEIIFIFTLSKSKTIYLHLYFNIFFLSFTFHIIFS